MKRQILSLSLALSLLALAAPSWATVIYVSGDQIGTWEADTVIVTAEVRVPPGRSLTIFPSVEVLFSVYCKLIVDSAAVLRAVGTATDSIRFDALQDTAHWHGIRFLSASDFSHLEYCHFTHGHALGIGEDQEGGAIYCSNSDPSIQHCLMDGCSAQEFGGAIYCNSSNLIINCNTISGNLADGVGGAITCWGSSPIISGNTISGNTANQGGGIYCTQSNPSISGNNISGNSASYRGGGICCENSSPTISDNTISGNSATGNNSYGGGIYCYNSSPTISGNTLSENSAGTGGGGIGCVESSSPSISGNTISGNSGGQGGGGIACMNYSSPSISGNTISGNSALYYGSGIWCFYSSATISGNDISSNSTTAGGPWYGGGGIFGYNSSLTLNKNSIVFNEAAQAEGGGIWFDVSPTLVNCIFWGNGPDQIYGAAPQVSYSDIQGDWIGTGNINIYPAFVDTAQHDYRLQWGSPCIDAGDPLSPHDPDGTRADMGAWYYDQSRPVRILLTPYNTPIQIPATGGNFQYALQATNIGSSPLTITAWCNVMIPSGKIYGPVLEPVTISLESGQTLSHLRTQDVPASAPAGMYHYHVYAVAAGDTSTDSFNFTKLVSGDWGLVIGGWTNTGEDFAGQEEAVLIHPSSSILQPCSPNPFNPTTQIHFALPQAGRVSLKVFNTAGQLVTILADGQFQAGWHAVTWDASDLSTGLYIYRLDAGGKTFTQKAILIK